MPPATLTPPARLTSLLCARKVVPYFNQRGTAENEIEKLSKREREVLDRLAEGTVREFTTQ